MTRPWPGIAGRRSWATTGNKSRRGWLECLRARTDAILQRRDESHQCIVHAKRVSSASAQFGSSLRSAMPFCIAARSIGRIPPDRDGFSDQAEESDGPGVRGFYRNPAKKPGKFVEESVSRAFITPHRACRRLSRKSSVLRHECPTKLHDCVKFIDRRPLRLMRLMN